MRLVRWVACHPRAVTWILVMTTANFILNVLITTGVFR